MIRKNLLVVPVLFVLASACNSPRDKDSEKIAEQNNEQKTDSSKAMEKIEDDSKFVVEAVSGVTMETELGRFAEKNAVSAGVKEFGATMLRDHSKDKQKLEKLASEKNITIPTRTGEDFQKHINEITSKKGVEFDKAYIDFMVGDHKNDISEFQKEVKDGKDAEIKAFATEGIPVLQHHLQMAQSLHDNLK